MKTMKNLYIIVPKIFLTVTNKESNIHKKICKKKFKLYLPYFLTYAIKEGFKRINIIKQYKK